MQALKTSELVKQIVPDIATAGSEWTQLPLREQLEKQRVRQLELDLYIDPKGEMYQEPIGLKLARLQGISVPPFDPEGVMTKPGFKIFHSAAFDYRTTVRTFKAALEEINAWSRAHPRHVPIMIEVELKPLIRPPRTLPPITDPAVKAIFEQLAVPIRWTAADMAAMEQEILSVLPRNKILTPDDVRGDAPTLRDAVLTKGWPEIDSVRGRFMFTLDNEGEIRDLYLGPAADLKGRLLFASVGPEHQAAAWMKLNSPARGFARVQEMVKKGFIIRTRADEEAREAKANNTDRREKALESGAHYISTDFPTPDKRYGPYFVQLPGGVTARLNPVTGPAPK
jgi:hypothetical protein